MSKAKIKSHLLIKKNVRQNTQKCCVNKPPKFKHLIVFSSKKKNETMPPNNDLIQNHRGDNSRWQMCPVQILFNNVVKAESLIHLQPWIGCSLIIFRTKTKKKTKAKKKQFTLDRLSGKKSRFQYKQQQQQKKNRRPPQLPVTILPQNAVRADRNQNVWKIDSTLFCEWNGFFFVDAHSHSIIGCLKLKTILVWVELAGLDSRYFWDVFLRLFTDTPFYFVCTKRMQKKKKQQKKNHL